MENLLNSSPEMVIIIFINLLVTFILLIINIINNMKLKRLRKKYNNFMSGLSGKNIEDLLENCLKKINAMKNENVELRDRVNNIERNLSNCVQKVGVVRYNAFEDMGSDLSFAVALLDNSNNGVVLSGIYSRENSSTYAKPIIFGKSKYPLSVEEMQAMDEIKKAVG